MNPYQKLEVLLCEHTSTVNILNTYITMRALQMTVYMAAIALIYSGADLNMETPGGLLRIPFSKLLFGQGLTIVFWLWEYRSTATWKVHREHLLCIEHRVRDIVGFDHPTLGNRRTHQGVSSTYVIICLFSILFLTQFGIISGKLLEHCKKIPVEIPAIISHSDADAF